ncbi:hypothetical protein K437DRAFT_255747 [Tilletiaria anomala UBC 951]|uniref:TECPR1-like DysF domain-containing protein n=1 Tax=Tilletiaria anomala (strain ATCC 24038 / CBS 436.72 / UBC 951) TaxID=1037660 RepID=A0A066W5B6_TILAU|nr:uncharacterized protein K437DRAFT_255747 [Tilletiaria anomala UBC 951]KDN47738.1 hypothetical protein K437DRAFT_255747 [Tilletiaria anomala UBC 951]
MASPPPSPTGSYSATPSISNGSQSGGSAGFSAKLTNTISSYLFESAISISATPTRLPTQRRKTPLSLPQTTSNFRQFVQKSGGLFYFQDAVEATLLWDDWSWTLMWMGIWAVIAIYPYLLLAAPSFILCIILMKTHQARFPPSNLPSPGRGATTGAATSSTTPLSEAEVKRTPADVLRHSVLQPSSIGEGAVRPPLVPSPPAEGSVRYLENLRDIQNMMKMIPDGYDAIVPIVPYLNWSSYNRSLLVLQLSILTTIVMFFIGPLLPLRLIFLIGGEAVFISKHPWVQPVIEAVGKIRASAANGSSNDQQLRSVMRKRGREASHRLRTWLELDRLEDSVWEKGWRDVEMFENERFGGPGADSAVTTSTNKRAGWGAGNIRPGERKPWTKASDGWSAASELEGTGYELDLRQVASSLEKGWAWVEGDDWRIDWAGGWSAVGVDDEGYVYTDGDWQRPAPYPYGHPGEPEYPVLPPEAAAATKIASDGADVSRSRRETDGRSLPAAALSSNVKAQTRRRRWLRRAVRV